MRLIDADEFYRILENKATMDEVCLLSHTFSLKELAHILHNQPAVEERPKGEWIYNKIGYPYVYTCSECGYHNDTKNRFCPYCGADMRGEE